MSAPDGTTPAPDPGLTLAQSAIARLLQAGVREFVVCAGARNAALVAVLAATRTARLWSFPEERCAGFFALGRSRACQAPVAVVTTSGTAVAELLPAVIEAHYLGVPIILVTADRPRSFRGTGAPQAIEQPGIFGSYVSACVDVEDASELATLDAALAARPLRRPVHLNLCLQEPDAAALASAGPAAISGAPEGCAEGETTTTRDDSGRLEAFLADDSAGPLVAVAGALPAGEQPAVAAFLQRLGCPVIAEATSGLRESPQLAAQRVFAGETTLAALTVGRVLRIGGVPSSRWWRDLEHRPDVRVLSLTTTGFPGLARPSEIAGIPDWSGVRVPAPQASHGMSGSGQSAPEGSAPDETTRTLAAHPRSEPSLVHALSHAIPCGSLVFLGNSLPIREWNVFASRDDRRLRCHANRGANGIDGCVSTFLGLAADEPESWAVIGDLTALYDLAALWITPALPAGRRRIAVINNGGGRIFSRVAALKGLATAPKRIMENPHRLTFRAWADMFGWTYAAAATPEAIAEAAGRPEPDILLEITPDAAETEAVWAALTARTTNHPTDDRPMHTPAPHSTHHTHS